jgi:hypothetical protein
MVLVGAFFIVPVCSYQSCRICMAVAFENHAHLRTGTCWNHHPVFSFRRLLLFHHTPSQGMA